MKTAWKRPKTNKERNMAKKNKVAWADMEDEPKKDVPKKPKKAQCKQTVEEEVPKPGGATMKQKERDPYDTM